MNNFNIGIIGAAGNQGYTWIKRIKSWSNLQKSKYKISALSDLNISNLKSLSDQLNCSIYNDYQKMLEKEELDLIIIASPHFLHAPMTISAAENGVNVLCEKPMCINLKQADEMKNAIDKFGIKFAVGLQHRFNPKYVGLKNAINSGDLGEIFQINMIYHWWRKEDYYLNSSPVKENEDKDWEGWRGHWETEGAGALANQLIHFLDIFQWLSPSPIESLMATSRVSKHTFTETDDNTNALIEFKNGSMGFIQAGVVYEHDLEEEFGIYGIDGALVQRKNINEVLRVPRIFEDYRSPELKLKKSVNSYIPKIEDESKAMFENFLESIRTDNSDIISVDATEGRKSVELMRGILLSQIYQKKINFPFVDKPDEFPKLLHTYTAREFEN